MDRTWTDEQLKEMISSSRSRLEVIQKLGLSAPGGYRTVNKYIRLLNLDISHFETQAERNKRYGKARRIDDAKLFVENSDYDTCALKRRIQRDSLIPYICKKCGQGDVWDGEPLVLQLDHINGCNRDNRLENLRYLCPNCHSQTATYCGRALRRPLG